MKHTGEPGYGGGSMVAGVALLLLSSVAIAGWQGSRLQVPVHWMDMFYLVGLSLGFWAIVLERPDHWWAVFPATLLAAGAGLLVVGPVASEHLRGVVFLSLACAFLLCYLLGRPRVRVRWAIYPAAVVALLGGLLMIDHVVLGSPVVPVLSDIASD